MTHHMAESLRRRMPKLRGEDNRFRPINLWLVRTRLVR
jgi:hypothetical protein